MRKSLAKEDRYFIYDNQNDFVAIFIVKRIISCILAVCYAIIGVLVKVKVKEKDNKVSICAIFKNEALYLREWIEFHRIVGIDHFYLYNNNSSDNYQQVLLPYIEKGIVTLVDWPYDHQQMKAYADCIKKFADETKWLGFIDIDEFIVPKDVDNVYDYLKHFEKKHGSVKIYWRLYGTSGLLERDITNFVTEDFTVCWPKYCNIGKCFYNTAFDFDEKSDKANALHHQLWANYNGINLPPVNIFNKICIGNRNKATMIDFPIQINHYFTKSFNEYLIKCNKGDVYFESNPHDELYFYEHESRCTNIDYSAYKYLIKLKKSIYIDDGRKM